MCELCNVVAAGHLCGANCSSPCACDVYPVQYDFVALSLTLSAAPTVHGHLRFIVAVQPLQMQRVTVALKDSVTAVCRPDVPSQCEI